MRAIWFWGILIIPLWCMCAQEEEEDHGAAVEGTVWSFSLEASWDRIYTDIPGSFTAGSNSELLRLKGEGPGFVPLDPVRAQREFMHPNIHTSLNVGPTLIVSDPQVFNMSNASRQLGLLGRSETAIAASSDGQRIVIGWNDPRGFLRSFSSRGLTGCAYSTDGGQTFTEGNPLPTGRIDTSVVVPRGDPWLDVAGTGQDTFYFANLAAREVVMTGVGVMVHRGRFVDGDLRWDPPSIIAVPNGQYNIFDKEALAADKRSGSTNVYVVLTNFINGLSSKTQIELYRSRDAAQTWQGPTVVKEPDSADQQGASMVVGTLGEVYVVWERGRFNPQAQIIFRASFDGGQTFEGLSEVAMISPVSVNPPTGFNRSRLNDFPRIAVDRSPLHKGRIYVVYQDARSNPTIAADAFLLNPQTHVKTPTGGVGDGDIYVKYSDDHGSTWSAPKLVSSNAAGDGKNQFWPVVSVAPDGEVQVIYYQDIEMQHTPYDTSATDVGVGNGWRRRSSFQSVVDIMWTQSRDGGLTFAQPAFVNEESSNWSEGSSNITPNYGDYIAGTAVSGRMYTAWAQNAQYDVEPGPLVSNRFVPSVAFVAVDITNTGNPIPPGRQPATYVLDQNYPNPFNPSTEISYIVPNESKITLKIFDTLGREVATLVDGHLDAGRYSARFNGGAFPSGIYFYKLSAGSFTSMKKMMLVK